jgi:hypothetical protein
MHAALGDDFTVEVGQLFQKPDVLEQYWAAGTCRQYILIVADRCTTCGC